MASSARIRHITIAAIAIVFVSLVALYSSLLQALQPDFSDGSYTRSDTGETLPFSLPLDFESPEEMTASVRLTMRVPAVHFSRFTIIPDDCIEEISINGEILESDDIPFCDYAKGRTFDLGAYMQTGENELAMTLRNSGGPSGIRIAVAGSDPLLFFLRTILIIDALLSIVLLATVLPRVRSHRWLVAILCLGVLLRFLYFFYTPYTLRGHDTEGHIDYVNHVAEHWTIPKIGEGWEFYQPPLYYFVAAGWKAAGDFIGREPQMLLQDIHAGALLSSIVSFLICLWMGMRLFPEKSQRLHRILFALPFAVFPSILYTGARINNDVLLYPLSFLTIALLLKFWKGNNVRFWYGAVVAAALAVLTKGNGILLLPILFGCLLFWKGKPFKKRIAIGAASLGVLAIFLSWYAYHRIVIEDQRALAGNIGNLHSGLLVEHDLETLTEFNPVRVVKTTYNNPWEDEAGRQYFWEYFYRSAFFGEFNFGEKLKYLGRALLILSMILFPLALFGIVRDLRKHWYMSLPFLLTMLVLLAGHVAYRQSAPYSSSQDFRYSLLILVPLSYYLVIGVMGLPRMVRYVASGLAILFSLLCAAFVIGIGIVK